MNPPNTLTPSGASQPQQPVDASNVDNVIASTADVIRSVYVYEVPVRIWHWTNALSVVVLAITGYLIGSPLPSISGEASDHFLMGYIRFAHFTAAYVMAIGLIGRTYWAFAGNYYSRELYWVPLFQLEYWKDVLQMLKWYSFVSPRPGIFIGHNPLARFSMFFTFMVPSFFMMLTGFAMYSEGEQAGSFFELTFGWVIPLFGQSQDVHTWHHFGMYSILCFVMLHIYAGVREEIMGRTSMLSTMISGHRTFKD
jgi:Ni/Fe-hydrogenase 1 B-type cytochrome subunit